jgi:hypothetical protein
MKIIKLFFQPITAPYRWFRRYLAKKAARIEAQEEEIREKVRNYINTPLTSEQVNDHNATVVMNEPNWYGNKESALDMKLGMLRKHRHLFRATDDLRNEYFQLHEKAFHWRNNY